MQRIPLLPSMTGAALAVILGSQSALADLLSDHRDRCGRARSLRRLGHAQCR